ncbi:hypothetical protein [Pseudonocardia sp. ICBG1142]|uniref:hypothetical protein n=1 Tax=Pseudonocardia sp. ICBG1142 TaxID=2846760 RepID=UPI001CF670C3|nr:hypothetical protein [Pseudonocardia sp. ICBG1142]
MTTATGLRVLAATGAAALTLSAAGVATAAEDIHYEKAGTFPDVAACADAGHTTPGVTTWLCDEHPDGTADLYLVPA